MPETFFEDLKGTAARTSEMSIFRDMMYGHDMKISKETRSRMGRIEPQVLEGEWNAYDRTNDAQRAICGPVLDSINTYFEENWPTMTDREKLEWKYQRYMQDYLGCISSVDVNIGRVLDYLDESDLAENTIVVYTSGQGFFHGEHGWFDKRFIYEESFKTPLLVRWPGKTSPAGKSTAMVQNLDFAPTFLEAVRIDIPVEMQGESFVPILQGQPETWKREAVYYHYLNTPDIIWSRGTMA